jgi:NAD(P)H-dependent nitrite reductase small subunit
VARYHRAARVEDVPPGTGRIVRIDDTAIALFNIGGTFYAMDNTCPHQGGPLGEGWLKGSVVTCPWHFWQFDVRTGAAPEFPEMNVPRFPVKVEAGEIFVADEPIEAPS